MSGRHMERDPPQETLGGVRSHSVFASNQAPEVAVGESGLLEGSTPMPRNERWRGQLQSLEVLPPVGPRLPQAGIADPTSASGPRVLAAGRGRVGLRVAGAWQPKQLLCGRWAPASGRGGHRWADGRSGADAAAAGVGPSDGPGA